MRITLYLTAVISAMVVSSQPTTNQSTNTTITTTNTTNIATTPIDAQTGVPKENESSSLSQDQYVYHTFNASHDPRVTDAEGTATEASLGIHLLDELQKVYVSSDSLETNGEGTLTEASPDIHLSGDNPTVNASSGSRVTDSEGTLTEASPAIQLLAGHLTFNASSDSVETEDNANLTEPSLGHHPGNVSSDSRETFDNGNLTEASLDISLLSEPHNCTENIQNETLDVSCPDVASLYAHAKKIVADIHHLQVRVINVSGPLDLSQIIGPNSTLLELDLSYANITAFSYIKNYRWDFQKLLKLNLNGNPRFNTTSFVTLGNLPNLVALKLHGLKLDNRILSETFLKAAPNIELLDISNTGVRHMPTEVFENTPNLKILDASMNDLFVFKLEKQFLSRLIHLNISQCRLQSLEIESGGPQESIIEVLDVSHNSLTALKSGLVSRLAPDAALNVDDNEWECSSCSLYHLWEYLQKRTKVSGGSQIKSCFDLSSLANCDWVECPFGCTCTEATKTVNCTALGKSMIPGVGPSDTQVLILNDNQINSLKNIDSSSWCQLREILIDQNRLSNFETSDLQGSCSCKHDYDEENCFPQSLTTISAAYNNIKELPNIDCDFLQEIKFLNLSHNEMMRAGAPSCGHTIIKDLDVSYNRIEKIEKRDLASLPLIENLILSNNRLTSFHRYQKNITPYLKYLDLSHNKIKRIEDELSSNDSRLKKGWEFDPAVQFKLDELYLHSNQLGDSGGFLKVINISKSLKKITLHDNPWVCDCAFDYESAKDYKLTSIDNINKMVCHHPHNTPVINFLRNCTYNVNTQMKEGKPLSIDNKVHNIKEDNQTHKSLKDLIAIELADETQGNCTYNVNTQMKEGKPSSEDNKSTTDLIVIVVMAMILVGLFLWLCRFNTCVTKTLNGGQTNAELADETQGRKYDVFVVHSGEDRDFVNDHVITPLAAKGYLVAWHENMFTPGNYIYENIEKAVKNSRRMLVVATDNFTKSHWGIKEIRRGRHEEVDVHGYKITALVTNSLPRELKTELYQIVQERTHVAFSDRDYIEKICDFLPRPDPRMLSSPNTTISNASLHEFLKQIFTTRNSSEGSGDSLPTVFQIFNKDIDNGQVTINVDVDNQTIGDSLPTVFTISNNDIDNGQVTINTKVENKIIDDGARVAECITINKTRFKILPVNDESYKRNVIHSRVSFRRQLSGASSVETFPRYTCLPPTPEDEEDEEDFPGPRLSRGVFVRVSCRF